jgi:hypothetical protein
MISMLFIGCSEQPSLDRASALSLLNDNLYPMEIVNYFPIKWEIKHAYSSFSQEEGEFVAKLVDIFSLPSELTHYVAYSDGGREPVLNAHGRPLGGERYWFEVRFYNDGEKYKREKLGQDQAQGSMRGPFVTEKIPVVSHTASVESITGIVFLNQEKTQASVEYIEVREATPLGKALHRLFQEGVYGAEIELRTQKKKTFVLYDDGWRISKR